MESTVNDSDGAFRAGTRKSRTNADAASPSSGEGRGEEIQNLIAHVQSLLDHVRQAADPEIDRLRLKIEEALAAGNWVAPGRIADVRRRARNMLSAGDGYVRDRPWQSAGIAALAGVVVGILVGRR
jgi:ElaB/YqjD/DUF883 family membrane-anchored ribosome-binding protein